MEQSLARLLGLLAEIASLNDALALMDWDQETYMPAGGGAVRARNRETLARLIHARYTSDELGDLLDALAAQSAGMDPSAFVPSLVRVTRRQRDRLVPLPARLVADLARERVLAQQAWEEARKERDFERFRPRLERIVALAVEKAECLRGAGDRYDALLDEYEPGMPGEQVKALFERLTPRLAALADLVCERRAGRRPSLPRLAGPEQRELGVAVLTAIGFDLGRGRLDASAHPMTVTISPDDVRLTTHGPREDWTGVLFGVLHEGGHGIHGQGIPRELDETPLGASPSLGVSESQSRMWENVVGRSRAFWQFFLPLLQDRFPERFGGLDLDTAYRAVNHVARSPVRVAADEVTYDLHVAVRFELERDLVGERLAARELPDAWNALMERRLRVTPKDDAEGVLQDIHWSEGLIGYFPTYTLGNVLAVQFYQQALAEHPEIPDDIARGRFDTLRHWTNARIHARGAALTANELVREVTGRSLDAEPYLRYLEEKYRAL